MAGNGGRCELADQVYSSKRGWSAEKHCKSSLASIRTILMPSKTHDSLSSQFWVVSPARKRVRLQMMVKMFIIIPLPVGGRL